MTVIDILLGLVFAVGIALLTVGGITLFAQFRLWQLRHRNPERDR